MFQILQLQKNQSKKEIPVEDAQWVKELCLLKKEKSSDVRYRRDVVDQHKETTQQALEVLEYAGETHQDLTEMRTAFEQLLAKFFWMLEKEKEVEAASDRKMLTEEERQHALRLAQKGLH